METLDEEPSALVLSFKWTDEYTKSLIRLRNEKREYFTGKRNTARSGWEYVLKEMGLDGIVSVKQAKKKWDNLVHKYKELKNARLGTADGEIAVSSWPFYQIMDETLGNGPMVTLPVVIASIVEQDVESYIGESSNGTILATLPNSKSGILNAQLVHGAAVSADQLSNTEQPLRKKRKKESEDSSLELFRQAREDWLRMHNTLERQGEVIISLFSELVRSVKRT